jgi:hypothetical protein
MPVVDGRKPVSKLEREALQPGAEQWAFVKSNPRLAKRSMFGVRACGCPPSAPTQSLRSSTAMNNTFGLAAPAWPSGRDNRKARQPSQMRMRVKSFNTANR